MEFNNFGKYDILFRCNSCGKEKNVQMEFIPDRPINPIMVEGAKVLFKPNPDEIKCPRCNGPMNPTVYLPDIIGE